MAVDDFYARVTGRYALLSNGEIKIEDLDDEELARGQLRAVDGSFRGRPPKFIPQELVVAMRREFLTRANDKLKHALLEKGVGTYVEIAGDPDVDAATRLRAAEKIVERVMGKVPDKIEVAAEDPVETLFRKILSDPHGLTEEAPVPREFSAEEREMLS